MKQRARRRAQARRQITAELKGEHPDWSEKRCEREAELELRRHDFNPHFADELLRVCPQSYLPHRSKLSPEVEARAWVEHPVMQWLIGVVCGPTNGRPADRHTLLAALMQMVSGSRPDMQEALRAIAQSALLMWAHVAPPTRAATSAAYATLKALVDRHPAGLCIHANLEMVLEMAALTKPNGKPMFTDPLRDVAVDGMLMSANVPQRAPKGRSKRERKARERRIAGPDRPMAQFVVYADGRVVADATDDGDVKGKWRRGIRKACFGYKVVALCSIKLQVPIIWTLIPAGGDERVALRALIRALYRLVPDFPMRYLVGDGLYGMDADLIEWLDRCYGVVGVFPMHSGFDKKLPFSATLGVPKCKHGWPTHLGVRNEWAPKRRRDAGLAPGDRAPGAPGHRWKCREGKSCPEIRDTYSSEDWRLMSQTPHDGDSLAAARRSARSRYRNVLESIFSLMQHRGVGAGWPPRLRIGGDQTARWITSLTFLRLTAARLAHANGEYDRLLKRAVEVGVIRMNGQHPIPISGLRTRPAEQQAKLDHDIAVTLDEIPPATLTIAVTLPIDEPYRLPDLTEFSDIPDRPQ